MSFCHYFQDQVPSSTALLGDKTNLISTNLAQKLGKFVKVISFALLELYKVEG